MKFTLFSSLLLFSIQAVALDSSFRSFTLGQVFRVQSDVSIHYRPKYYQAYDETLSQKVLKKGELILASAVKNESRAFYTLSTHELCWIERSEYFSIERTAHPSPISENELSQADTDFIRHVFGAHASVDEAFASERSYSYAGHDFKDHQTASSNQKRINHTLTLVNSPHESVSLPIYAVDFVAHTPLTFTYDVLYFGTIESGSSSRAEKTMSHSLFSPFFNNLKTDFLTLQLKNAFVKLGFYKLVHDRETGLFVQNLLRHAKYPVNLSVNADEREYIEDSLLLQLAGTEREFTLQDYLKYLIENQK